MRVRARRVLVIANPAAGLTRRRNAGEQAARGAKRAGAFVELHVTSGPGDATAAASRAKGAGFDLVLAAGGDGTAHEATNGLAGSGVPLGIAPAGTMNLLARVLDVPLDPALAAERLAEGSGRLPMRPGRAAGRLFLLMAGAGFDAWVLRELLSRVRGKIRFRDYTRGALKGLWTFPFPELSIETDAGTFGGHSAIVGRAPLYGGFLRPTPHARLDATSLEMCALSGGPVRLAVQLARMWSGAHGGRSGAVLAETSRVTIRSERADLPYQLDGELHGVLPVDIDVAQTPIVLARPSR